MTLSTCTGSGYSRRFAVHAVCVDAQETAGNLGEWKSLLHIEWRDDFMCHIALSIPDEVLYDTKMSHEQANQFARQAVALAYYTQSGVSIGYCSRIAGMTEEEFLEELDNA